MKTKRPKPKMPEGGDFFEQMFKKFDEEEVEIEGMTQEQIKEITKKISPVDYRNI